MRIIPVNLEKQPRKSWYLIYSHMLSPDCETLQKSIFSYYYCSFLLSKKNEPKYNKTKQNIDFQIVTRDLLYAISYGDFLGELKAREKCIRASGILMRLLYSIEKTGNVPSMNKAASLFRVGFGSKEREKGVKPFKLSYAEVVDYYKDHYDVFHLCAAYSIIKPSDVIHGKSLKERLYDFLAIADEFKRCGEAMFRGSNTEKGKLPIINHESVYHVDANCIFTDRINEYKLGYDESRVTYILSHYRQDTKCDKFLKDNPA